MLVTRLCRLSIARSPVRGSVSSLGCQGLRNISTEVYIKGLGDVNEEQVSRFMSPYGIVTKCSLSKQPAPRGTLCTLTFADITGAIAAVDALDDTVIFGRRVNVRFSPKRASSVHDKL